MSEDEARVERVAQAICGDDNPANILSIHRIRARAAIAAATAWQPIETAPRDGTPIDLLLRGSMRFTDCKWSEGEWWTIEGDGPSVCLSYGPSQPTHWMPLPELPIDGRKANAKA